MKAEAPPPSRIKTAAIDWRAKADELRASPGEWFVVKKNDATASVAPNIRRGQLRAFTPAGAFEATARVVKGKRRVYARYVGESADG